MLSDSHSGSHSFKANQKASHLACVCLVRESRILKAKGSRLILVHLLTSLYCRWHGSSKQIIGSESSKNSWEPPISRDEMPLVLHYKQSNMHEIITRGSCKISSPFTEIATRRRAIVPLIQGETDTVLGNGAQHFLCKSGNETPGDCGEGTSHFKQKLSVRDLQNFWAGFLGPLATSWSVPEHSKSPDAQEASARSWTL